MHDQATAFGAQGSRARRAHRRTLHRHAARRVRSRGHQDRTPRTRRRTSSVRADGQGREPLLGGQRPQQEICRPGPQEGGGPDRARRTDRPLRRARQQPETGHPGKLGFHRGGPESVLSDAGNRSCQRVRPDRSQRIARRIRPGGAGIQRPERPDRGGRRAADAGRWRHSRLRFHDRPERSARCSLCTHGIESRVGVARASMSRSTTSRSG